MPASLRSVLGCFVLALLLLSSTSLSAAENASRRWALLIGVNDYAHIQELSYCSNDVQALKAQLHECGFPEEQIYLLNDEAKDARFRPLKSNVERYLRLMLETLVGKDDLVLVAFSGHGMHIDGQTYLCPTEADADDPAGTMVSMETVYEQLNKCPARMKLLVIDACRNDPRPKGSRSATPKEDAMKLGATFEKPPRGIMVLTSCAPGEIAWEDDELSHGVFMHFMLKGLSGEADRRGNRNGRISLTELWEFANLETNNFVVRSRARSQRPSLRGEIDGVFDLAVSDQHPVRLEKFADPNTNSLGMQFTLIPAGEFVMGSHEAPEELVASFPGTKPAWIVGEQPQHRVRITRSFYMGTHEVTLGQFLNFVNEAGYEIDAIKDRKGGWGWDEEKTAFEQVKKFVPWSWGFAGQTNQHPVVNISWNDAVAFCEWLSGQEGKTYRLPTEAEWEYACRAGSEGRYYFGDDAETLADWENVADRTAKAKFPWWEVYIQARDGFAFTAPVGAFRPNSFGLYDMVGNAIEWCSDWYGNDYYSVSATDDPQGPVSGAFRVIRGCGWDGGPVYCRSANRSYAGPTNRNYNTGFRVVCER